MKRRREDENNPQAEPAGQPPLKNTPQQDSHSGTPQQDSHPGVASLWRVFSNFISSFRQPEPSQPQYFEPPTDGCPIATLPPEMLAQILSLTPFNLQLREVNHAFANNIDYLLGHQLKAQSGQKLDSQWQKQQAEIDYLQQYKGEILKIVKNSQKVIRAFQRLNEITNQTTLALFAREKTLNFINEAIVRQKIDKWSIRLECAKCHLTRFPEALIADPVLTAFWTKLQWLELNSNQLSSVPDNLGQLTALQILDLGENQLSLLPERLDQLSVLKELSLDGNQLSTVPNSVARLTAILWLSLSSNQLSTVPECLGQLTTLEELYLDSNQLGSLPACLSELSGLRRLSLSHNHLDALPDTLSENILVNQQGYSITKEQVLQAQTERLADSEKKPTALGRS